MSSEESSSSSSMDSKVASFCSIMGVETNIAEQMLNACDGNLEMAMNMHMESNEPPNGTPPPTNQQSTSTIPLQDDEEEVRAPIPQKRERLIDEGFTGYRSVATNPHKNRIKNVVDGFRNFETEAGSSSSGSNNKSSLESLFKPPLDLLFNGNFNDAKEIASSKKKWLLINIQDPGEFQCQVLNRDVWSHSKTKNLIGKHFIFWQQYKESEYAQVYMNFYPVREWPHIAILDPRTGEKLTTWNRIDNEECFQDLVSDFLDTYTDFNESLSSPPPKRKKANSILDANEEDQIAAAIRASLAESAPNRDSDTESELDVYSGDDSNISAPQTPVKSKSQPLTSKKEETITSQSSSNGNSTSTSSNSNTNSNKDVCSIDNWQDYIGKEDVNIVSKILIRFPDGRRETKDLPASSQFKAISLYVTSQGYPLDNFEIVTNFPRKILTQMDPTSSLKDLGLFPKETIFVQVRT